MDYAQITDTVCRKCVMGGANGTEEACVPLHMLLKIQADPKRICPRHELAEDELVPAELALLCAKVGADHPLFNKLFDLHTEGIPHSEKLYLFYRVLDVVSDPGISARIKAARERALKEKN